MTTTITLYTINPPAHVHRLFVAPRPLPGRQVGRCNGMVFDVAPEFEQRARELDGQPITVTTAQEYEQAVEAAVATGGYSRSDYEEINLWDPEELGRQRGLVLITIRPEGHSPR